MTLSRVFGPGKRDGTLSESNYATNDLRDYKRILRERKKKQLLYKSIEENVFNKKSRCPVNDDEGKFLKKNKKTGQLK